MQLNTTYTWEKLLLTDRFTTFKKLKLMAAFKQFFINTLNFIIYSHIEKLERAQKGKDLFCLINIKIFSYIIEREQQKVKACMYN